MPTPASPSPEQTSLAQKMRNDTLWDYFQSAPVPLKVISDDADLMYYNAAFSHLLGTEMPKVIATRSIEEITFSDDIEKTRELYEQIFSGQKEHANIEARLIRQDGSIIWVQEIVIAQKTGVPNRLDKPTFALILCADITAQKEIERRVEQSERMRSIGQLTSSVAHDFNNILTILSSHADLLREGVEAKENETILNSLKKINDAIDSGVALTRQLSEYGFETRKKVIDLNAHIQNTNSLLSHYFNENFSIELDLHPGAISISVAPGKLDQVLLNLALNARDAMPSGGKLVIRTCRVKLQEADLIAHPSLQAGEHVLLEVCDNGEGIPFEIQNHIFDPFFTTKSKPGSSGLGLATVFGILKQLGGAIYVDSTPNQGTKFSLYFPSAETSDTPRPEPMN